jgi:transposase
MTARTQRIEVITRGERRRRWSIEEKREIVAESLGAGIRPSEIINKYGITSGQLYAWRQQLTRRVEGQPPRPSGSFARVDVVAGELEEVRAAAVTEAPVAPAAKP